MPIEVEFTADGYLHLPMELAGQYFPTDGVVALLRGPELWLMPTHNNASGGYLLKQRNRHGDRSLLIREALEMRSIQMRAILGRRVAYWDEREGALRVALRPIPDTDHEVYDA